MGCRHSIQAANGADASTPQKSVQSSNEGSQLHHQVDEASVVVEQQPQHGWDDFTKDYRVIKHVTGGAVGSGLSNFYIVIKHEVDATEPGSEEAEEDRLYILQMIDIKSVAPERRKAIIKELQSLEEIQHPNILRVCNVYNATRKDSTISTVTEMCTGQHLHSTTPYPEARVRTIVAQLLSALQYMHHRGLYHNNLTTENILFQDDSQDAVIKITYAGVASAYAGSSKSLMSPDWDRHGKDVYSVGMIAYKLFSGDKEPPTDMDTQLVAPGTNLFFGRRWKLIQISRSAKQFIEKCLQSDSAKQISVEQATRHPWITQERTHRTVARSEGDARASVGSQKLSISSPGTQEQLVTDPIVPVSLSAEQYNLDVKSRQWVSDSDVPSKAIGIKPADTTTIEPIIEGASHQTAILPTASSTNGDEAVDSTLNDQPITEDDSDATAPILATESEDAANLMAMASIDELIAYATSHSEEQCDVLNISPYETGSDMDDEKRSDTMKEIVDLEPAGEDGGSVRPPLQELSDDEDIYVDEGTEDGNADAQIDMEVDSGNLPRELESCEEAGESGIDSSNLPCELETYKEAGESGTELHKEDPRTAETHAEMDSSDSAIEPPTAPLSGDETHAGASNDGDGKGETEPTSSSTPTLENKVEDDSHTEEQDEEVITPTPAEFLDFQEIFQQAENEKGEEMTVEYLKAKFATKYTEDEVNSWFHSGKFDDTSNLQYTELLTTVIKSRRTIEVRQVKEAFKVIDKGKRGFVTVGNLRAALGSNNNENIELLIKAADSKRDGRISYTNFAQVVKQWAGEDLTE